MANDIAKVVAAAQDNAIAKGKGQWYQADTMPAQCKCPDAVASVIRAFITLGDDDSVNMTDYRNAKWRWEDMVDAVLASSTMGIGPNHPQLQLAVLNGGENLRRHYQSKEQWLAAFGAGKPTLTQAIYDSMYHTMRKQAWLSINMPDACIFPAIPNSGTTASKGKTKKEIKVPRLA